MGDLVETSLAVSRRNEEDIGEVGMKIGANEVKRVSDYENQMMEIVGIIETLSKQLTEVRKKVGLKVGKEVEIKKVVKPSTKEEVVEKVAGVKVAEVPRLKPEEFLGKKNIIEKEGEENLEKVERKIRESEPRKKMKEEVNVVEPRAGIRRMLKKIVAKKKPEVKSEIKKKENVKKSKKKFWKRKIKKKKDTGKKNNHEERAEKKKAKK